MNQQQQNHRLRTRKERYVWPVCIDALHLSQQFLVMSGSFPVFLGLSPSAAVMESRD